MKKPLMNAAGSTTLKDFVVTSPRKRKTPDSPIFSPIEVPAQLDALSKIQLVDLCRKLIARMPKGSTVQTKKAKANDYQQATLFTMTTAAKIEFLKSLHTKITAAVKEVGHTSSNSPTVTVEQEISYKDFLSLVSEFTKKDFCTLNSEQIMSFLGTAELAPLVHPVKFSEPVLSFGDKKAENPYTWSYMKEMILAYNDKKVTCTVTVAMAGTGKPGSFRPRKDIPVDFSALEKFLAAEA